MPGPVAWWDFVEEVSHLVVSAAVGVRPIGSASASSGLPDVLSITVRKGGFRLRVVPTDLRRGGPAGKFGERHNVVGLTLGTCGHHAEFALSFELVSVRAASLTRPLNVTNPRAN
jgi:hypothetical protein